MNKDIENKSEHPVLYKSFIIRKENNCLGAYSYAYDIFINPLYNTWPELKSVIDALKLD